MLRPLSFGEILDGAFTLYRRNFVTFAVTALVPTLAILAAYLLLGGGIVTVMTGGEPSQGDFGAFMAGILAILAVMAAAWLVMWGALTREASQAYTGQPTSVGDGLAAGARAALPMLGALVVGGLAVSVVGTLVVVALMLILMILVALSPVVGAVIGGLLLLLGYVGIIMVAASLLFAVGPAIVVERAGPIQALERSVRLARGALGRIAGVMLVAVLITYLPGIAVAALTGGFATLANPEAVPTRGEFVTQQMLGLVVSVFTTPFLLSVITLLYYDRRVRTEALDVQMLTDSLAVPGD